MNELQQETARLTRSWMRHEASWLDQYLVAGVEDPRLNLQSILARHFLLRSLGDLNSQEDLMLHEYRFSAVMNWLVRHVPVTGGDLSQRDSVLHALNHGADNAEGLEIPRFVLQTFASLPAQAGSVTVPNYIEEFLRQPRTAADAKPDHSSLNCFQDLWRNLLAGIASVHPRPSVLEPACGSANDYRFLVAYGLAPLIDYTGLDLCEKNIQNARAMFPEANFVTGNVFELDAPDRALDLCVVQDLFEHLSLTGIEAAVKEVCRVTRQSICAGFFQMDEIPEHKVRPIDEYYCNLLSMAETRELFARHGFEAQVLHIDTFLRRQAGTGPAHNPNAYTFLLHRQEAKQS